MHVDRSVGATPSVVEADGSDDDVDSLDGEEDDPIVTHPPLHLSSVSLNRGERYIRSKDR